MRPLQMLAHVSLDGVIRGGGSPGEDRDGGFVHRRGLRATAFRTGSPPTCDASSARLAAGPAATSSPAMTPNDPPPLVRFLTLALGVLRPPPGRGRLALALLYGAVCHAVFAAAVLSMITAMAFGMSESLGRAPAPWSLLANGALLLQFPLTHSLLLSRRGARWLARLAPGGHGPTLATTTYAIVASVQILALFALWTPSGVVWWRAEGAAFAATCALYAGSWLMLFKAIHDAGVEVQSGALGWMSLAQDKPPVFPDMPTGGLFGIIRQPIYAAFALTLWTVPVWTPDQLAVAVSLTAYCLAAPLLKERRFERRYGARFRDYRARTPYVVPRFPTIGTRT